MFPTETTSRDGWGRYFEMNLQAWLWIAHKCSNGALKRAMIMYKIHIISLSYLSDFYGHVHTHNLRNSEINFFVPRPRTGCAKRNKLISMSIVYHIRIV